MQASVSELAARCATDALMMLLLEAELGILQLLHLRYRRDRAAVRLAGRIQQLALRRGVVEGVPEVVIIRLTLVLTD